MMFSNLLIIHKEEITTVTVVWILDFSKNYEWFEKPYQKLERVFHQVPKHREVGQKTRLRLVISTHFSGFGYPDETLFLVFDILHLSELMSKPRWIHVSTVFKLYNENCFVSNLELHYKNLHSHV